jgi:hypothetical protein
VVALGNVAVLVVIAVVTAAFPPRGDEVPWAVAVVVAVAVGVGVARISLFLKAPLDAATEVVDLPILELASIPPVPRLGAALVLR